MGTTHFFPDTPRSTTPPRIVVAEDHESLSREAVQRILSALLQKPNLLICAAGGSTPLRTYELLAEHCTKQPGAFKQLRVLKLDEWGGLDADDPGSCEQQMRSLLIDPLGVAADRYFGFRSDASDPARECERVRKWLESEGPVDLAVLGLGTNGHLGMNEPANELQPYAHVAQLAESSLRHPMLVRARKRPTHGLTLGMTELIFSRQILLLVSGAPKREPLARLLSRQISTDFPASFLWLHRNWMLLCDRAAAEGSQS